MSFLRLLSVSFLILNPWMCRRRITILQNATICGLVEHLSWAPTQVFIESRERKQGCFPNISHFHSLHVVEFKDPRYSDVLASLQHTLTSLNANTSKADAVKSIQFPCFFQIVCNDLLTYGMLVGGVTEALSWEQFGTEQARAESRAGARPSREQTGRPVKNNQGLVSGTRTCDVILHAHSGLIAAAAAATTIAAAAAVAAAATTMTMKIVLQAHDSRLRPPLLLLALLLLRR